MILVLALSLLIIGGLLLDKVNAEEFLKPRSFFGGEESSLSTLINNALLVNVNSNSIDEIASDDVKEQFIKIKEDGYNNNIIFEEPTKKMELLTSRVPFILPVPFP